MRQKRLMVSRTCFSSTYYRRHHQAGPDIATTRRCITHRLINLTFIIGYLLMSESSIAQQSRLQFMSDWPRIDTVIPFDAERETFIAKILEQMTLEEKIGQMSQPDLREVTSQEVTEFKL